MRKLNWLSKLSEDEARATSARFWDYLSQEAYPVSKGAIRIPISLEPFTLTRSEYGQLQSQIELLISAARKLVEAYFKDSELRTFFAVEPAEQELIECAADHPFEGVVRLDLLYGSSAKVIEINADFPDGLFMHDVTAQAINTLSGLSNHEASHAELFAKLLASAGVENSSTIFVGHDAERTFVDEFELCAGRLKTSGWKNTIAGPIEKLTYSDGHLHHDKNRVHVLRRGAELSKLRKTPQLLEQLTAAQTSGLRVINNFKMRLLGHKSLLAALHEKQFERYLSIEERNAVRTFVPLTLKLERADLKAISSEKDHWVLKPSDLAEGKGVSVGSSLSQGEWRERIDEAKSNIDKWIVQEKAELPQETFTLIDDGGITSHRAYYDLDPHVFLFNDKIVMGGMLVRFSSSEILNVMKGGGITYAFVK